MEKTKVIAEIGENFIGDIEKAKFLIEKAKEAGADFAKFQSYTPEIFKKDDPEYDWFRKVSLGDEAHFELKEHAEKCGIEFLSAPFSVERARFLCERLNLRKIKIASGVMLNFPILDYLNENADEVFLSTGMATLEEIKTALDRLRGVNKVSILHCVTQYPCEDKDANLKAIQVLKKVFPENEIGYSDHTLGITAPLAAVALGATVIEKHFTFDKNEKEGTDHILSVEPEELKAMVEHIRKIETLLGRESKEPVSGEKEIIDFVRNRFLEV